MRSCGSPNKVAYGLVSSHPTGSQRTLLAIIRHVFAIIPRRRWFSTVGQLAALLAFVAMWYGTQLLYGDAVAARAKAASIAFAGVFLW